MIEDLFVEIESTSEEKFLSQYSELINLLKDNNVEYKIIEDQVEFGIDQGELLLLSFNFLASTVMSGAAWDLIKNLAVKILKNLPTSQVENTDMKIIYRDPYDQKEIKINCKGSNLAIKFPDGTEIKVEK
jgi:hypothetical protein